jgi:murein DD-endopeptidase MepM/ murein hydrolase activator NlpD
MVVITIAFFFGCKKEHTKDSVEINRDFHVMKTTIEDTIVTIEDTIRKGEGPFNLMERLKIDRKIRLKILYSLANEADFTTLKTGEKFAAVYNSDTTQILEFIYFQDKITTHRIKILYENDTSYAAYVLDEKPSKVRHRLIKGTLNSPTLDTEFRSMGLAPHIVGIATNVLECKISFRTDARIGDKFELLLEEVVYYDTTQENGVIERILDDKTNVLFVSYSGVRAKEHKGYRYFDGDKSSSYNAHYTEDGEALIYSGLRYPLDKTHITSPYGNRRHPVTGKASFHAGIDYRAKVGTPVYAVAEGKVVISKYDKMSGNQIAIKHKDNTTSYYLHLNKRNIGEGAYVKARQAIGLSGNTGLSNGPHLHLGFKQANGTWMNPLSKRMIAAPKLTGERLEKLKSQIKEIKRIYEEF